LHNIGYSNLLVINLVHPTEFVSNTFTPTKFLNNHNKQIVQVGAWLRDTYGIYSLNDGRMLQTLFSGDHIQKAALLGYKMNGYYKPLNFFQIFRNPKWRSITHVGGQPTPTSPHKINSVNGEIPQIVLDTYNNSIPDDNICRDDICRDDICRDDICRDDICRDDICRNNVCRDLICRNSDYLLNKYVIGAINLLKRYDSSVVLLNILSDSDYDDLLSKNIVFLKLVDASAVNTIIECIVRNTPVVVNRLPAVIEMLGVNYPLFYNDITEVESILTTTKINDTFDYLVNLDKTSFHIQKFMQDVSNLLTVI
jgi:hypothetical protein